MDGKNGELANLKEQMATGVVSTDDPHDSWDADAFKSTLGESTPTPDPVATEAASVTDAESKSVTNDTEPEWETGAVFSIKSQKQLKGAAEANVHKKWGTFKETPDTPDIPDTPPSPDVPGTPEQEAYSKSYAEWKRTRDFYNGEITDGKPTGVEAEFNRDYEAFLINESKGWRRLANLPRRMFGLQPKLSAELEQKAAMSRTLRERYHKNALALLSLREQLPKKGNLSDEKRKAALDRYERMLTRKLLLGVDQGRKSVQEKVALEVASRDKQSRIRSSLEALRQVNQKYKYAKWGTMVLGYGVLAGATGGVGAAVAAGSWTAARIGGAVGLGGLAGAGFRKMGQEEEAIAETKLEDARTRATTSFFDRDFSEVEAEISKLAREVEQTKALNKAGAAIVAVGAGFAGGNMAGGILDAFDVGAAPFPPETPKPTPPTESLTPPREMGDLRVMEEIQELANKPRPVQEMGDLRVMEQVQELANKPKPIQEMGDLRVMEKVEELAQSKTEVPPAVEPPPVEKSPIITEEPPEEAEVHADHIYTVQKGDNLWKIMVRESEVLQGMSKSEQNAALTELFKNVDSLEPKGEFAKEAGVTKSGGDVDRIYPGEKINVSMFDARLREVLGMNVELPDSAPVPEPRPVDLPSEAPVPKSRPLNFPIEGPIPEPRPDTVVSNEPVISQGDPAEQISVPPDDSTSDEAVPDTNSVIESANDNQFASEAQIQQAVQDYVKGIEKATSGFIFNGRPEVTGSFAQLEGLGVQAILQADASGNIASGVTPEGWNRWVDTLQEQTKLIPANDNESLGQYIARVVSGNRAA